MKILRREEGSAMIELAMIVPILILLLLGTLDVVMLLDKAMMVTESAMQGAEYGAAKWDYASDITDMQGLPNYYASPYFSNYQVVATISCSCGPGGSAVSCSSTCSGVAPAQYAQVTATANLPLFFGVTGFPASIPYQSTARVRVSWKAGN